MRGHPALIYDVTVDIGEDVGDHSPLPMFSIEGKDTHSVSIEAAKLLDEKEDRETRGK